jgi:hypothetical protein
MDKINEENNTFFVTICSTDSLLFHPNNNQANFRVQFNKNIELLRNMEVGLVEIHLPKYKYYNITKSSITLIIEDNYNKKTILWKFDIKESYAANNLEFFSYIINSLSLKTEEDVKQKITLLSILIKMPQDINLIVI